MSQEKLSGNSIWPSKKSLSITKNISPRKKFKWFQFKRKSKDMNMFLFKSNSADIQANHTLPVRPQLSKRSKSK